MNRPRDVVSRLYDNSTTASMSAKIKETTNMIHTKGTYYEPVRHYPKKWKFESQNKFRIQSNDDQIDRLVKNQTTNTTSRIYSTSRLIKSQSESKLQTNAKYIINNINIKDPKKSNLEMSLSICKLLDPQGSYKGLIKYKSENSYKLSKFDNKLLGEEKKYYDFSDSYNNVSQFTNVSIRSKPKEQKFDDKLEQLQDRNQQIKKNLDQSPDRVENIIKEMNANTLTMKNQNTIRDKPTRSKSVLTTKQEEIDSGVERHVNPEQNDMINNF